MSTVRLNTSAIAAFESSTEVKAILAKLGEQIADDARANAPRRTGAMADSIDYEVGEDEQGAYVHVSWDAEHFYGLFSEVGTSRESARPFLRPAALKTRRL